jgi:hypothetical protein
VTQTVKAAAIIAVAILLVPDHVPAMPLAK